MLVYCIIALILSLQPNLCNDCRKIRRVNIWIVLDAKGTLGESSYSNRTFSEIKSFVKRLNTTDGFPKLTNYTLSISVALYPQRTAATWTTWAPCKTADCIDRAVEAHIQTGIDTASIYHELPRLYISPTVDSLSKSGPVHAFMNPEYETICLFLTSGYQDQGTGREWDNFSVTMPIYCIMLYDPSNPWIADRQIKHVFNAKSFRGVWHADVTNSTESIPQLFKTAMETICSKMIKCQFDESFGPCTHQSRTTCVKSHVIHIIREGIKCPNVTEEFVSCPMTNCQLSDSDDDEQSSFNAGYVVGILLATISLLFVIILSIFIISKTRRKDQQSLTGIYERCSRVKEAKKMDARNRPRSVNSNDNSSSTVGGQDITRALKQGTSTASAGKQKQPPLSKTTSTQATLRTIS